MGSTDVCSKPLTMISQGPDLETEVIQTQTRSHYAAPSPMSQPSYWGPPQAPGTLSPMPSMGTLSPMPSVGALPPVSDLGAFAFVVVSTGVASWSA